MESVQAVRDLRSQGNANGRLTKVAVCHKMLSTEVTAETPSILSAPRAFAVVEPPSRLVQSIDRVEEKQCPWKRCCLTEDYAR